MTSAVIGRHLGSVGSLAAADLWCAWVDEDGVDLGSLGDRLMSAEEHARLSRYKDPTAASRYVLTRTLVRSVLGGILGQDPARVEITVTDFGKPVVAEELHFNVSHSGDLVVLAVCRDRAVGIDVERRRDVPRADALIARWLEPFEKRDVDALRAGGASLSDAFLRVWSKKEARLKALGIGVGATAPAGVESLPVESLDAILPQRSTSPSYVGAVAFA